MILSICDSPDILKVFNIVKTIINIIKIVVPILLIISIMIDLFKNVYNPEDLNKTGNLIVKKIIAAVAIFLIPSLVSMMFNVIAEAPDTYKSCLSVATTTNIESKYDKHMLFLMQEVRKNPTSANYGAAIAYLDNIKDDSKRNEYEKELNEIKKKIDDATRSETPQINPDDLGGDDDEDDSSANSSFLATARKVWLKVVNGNVRYTYGNGNAVPPKGTHIDCSTYVSWVLYEYGYKDFGGWQTRTGVLYNTNYEKKYGWKEIHFKAYENMGNSVKPGDIVVRRCSDKGHTDIIVKREGKMKFRTYDCGSSTSFEHGKNLKGVIKDHFITKYHCPGKIIRVTPPNN